MTVSTLFSCALLLFLSGWAAVCCADQPAPLGTILYDLPLCGHPSSVTVDSGGLLYVAYENQDLVQALSADGTLLRNWTAASTAGHVSAPTGVAVDEGRALLWILSGSQNRMSQMNWDSVVTRFIDGQPNGQSALLFDATRQRLILPTYQQLISYNPITGSRLAENTFPYGPLYTAAFNDSDGTVYATMAGMTHIVQLDQQFNYIRRIPYPTPQFSFTSVQMARDVAGRFYITYKEEDALVVLDADGAVMWRSDGFLFGPTVVAVDAAGSRIYVSDFWRQRIVVFAGPNATDLAPAPPVPIPAPTSAPFPHCGPPSGLYDFQGISVDTANDTIPPG